MLKYMKLLRVRHYIKNILVFIPLFFGRQFLNGSRFFDTLVGTVCFCLISSAIYIINDICDAEKDRLHPTKKNRPIASGAVSVKTAAIIAIVCGLLSLTVVILRFPLIAAGYLALYMILNLVYSYRLKEVALLDICILVSGFLIRILFGSVVSGIAVSAWLYLTVISLSFYFALGKRRNELEKYNGPETKLQTRRVLSLYTKEFLDKNMYMCMGLSNGFYALWTMEHTDSRIIGTVPIVLLLTMRYSFILEGESEGDPVEVILKDKVILGLGCVYAIFLFFVLYMG